MSQEIIQVQELIDKYGFRYEFNDKLEMGIIKIFKDDEILVSLIFDHNNPKYNPPNATIIWKHILVLMREALSVYDVSLDKYNFSSIESFREYSVKRALIKKIGLSKDKLERILYGIKLDLTYDSYVIAGEV